jgi:dihydrofolate reductase
MRCAMVVAVDEHFAIGKHGNLLWSLPNDMKRFKDTTYGHHVLMGRKTYESIPAKFRPLPGRANIVVSRTQQFEGCKSVATIDEAFAFAADCNERELMIIGGSEIYKQLFERTDKIYLTIVHHTFEADAFFPTIDWSEWDISNEQRFEKDEKHAYAYSFLDLTRKSTTAKYTLAQ